MPTEFGVIHRLLRGEVDQIDPGYEDLNPGFGNMGYATGNHPSANMPAVVSNGRVFVAESNKLVVLDAAEKPFARPKPEDAIAKLTPLSEAELKQLYATWPIDWDAVKFAPKDGKWGAHVAYTPAEIQPQPGTLENPDEQSAQRANSIPDSVLDRYIWEAPIASAPANSPPADELRTKLSAAVDELISRPAWMPLRFQGGKHPGDALLFYSDPTDPLLALAMAWPHLSPQRQKKVIEYVSADWITRNPIVKERLIAPDSGEPREWYRVPPGGVEARVLGPMLRERGAERAYAAWLWGQNTGQWEMIRPLWDALKTASRWNGASIDRDSKNAYLSGLIAVCRMAKQFNDQPALEENLIAARAALRERIEFELRFSRGNLTNRYPGWLWQNHTRWTYLTPEIGRAVREQAGEPAVKLVQDHLDRMYGFWYLTWGPVRPAALETSMQLPQNNLTAFLAKAYIENAPPQKLAIYTDIPACKADPYYIQKLAITLNAMSRLTGQAVK